MKTNLCSAKYSTTPATAGSTVDTRRPGSKSPALIALAGILLFWCWVNAQQIPTFTKITQGALVTDRLDSYIGSWGDYDNDGRLDVLVSGPINQWRLYHNDGNAMFSGVTTGVLSQRSLHGMSGVWGDPDNDGDLDFYAGPTWTSSESPWMYWNDGQGNFVRQPVDESWTSNQVLLRGVLTAWDDFDRDGFLDAFLDSEFSRYWGPATNALLYNNGDGTFAAVTNNVLNIRNDDVEWSYAVDYDNDDALDLILLRRGPPLPTQFYHNDGHGVFTEATPEPIRSEVTYCWNAAWADFDNDGDLDVFFAGLNASGGSPEHLYVNNGDGNFSPWTGQPASFEGDLPSGWYGLEAWVTLTTTVTWTCLLQSPGRDSGGTWATAVSRRFPLEAW